MNVSVKMLIEEITSYFEGTLVPDFDYLLREYNAIVKSLLLMLPGADASVTVTAENGKINCEVEPCRIKRIFAGEYELLKSSRELISLLPDAKLYHTAADGIYTTVRGECTVFYRTLPELVTAENADAQTVFGDGALLLLVRTYLERCAYFYIGDYASADACSVEYNRLLDNYKRENGVRE